jgi:hypothetical protein
MTGLVSYPKAIATTTTTAMMTRAMPTPAMIG